MMPFFANDLRGPRGPGLSQGYPAGKGTGDGTRALSRAFPPYLVGLAWSARLISSVVLGRFRAARPR